MGRHGGGAFSGKDPSKVDRSAAYAARWVAKNIVEAGLARRCELQLSLRDRRRGAALDPRDDGRHERGSPRSKIEQLVREHFDLKPRGIIEALKLLRPIYRKTASGGHFGRALPEFTWEKTDKADALRAAAGLDAKPRREGGRSLESRALAASAAVLPGAGAWPERGRWPRSGLRTLGLASAQRRPALSPVRGQTTPRRSLSWTLRLRLQRGNIHDPNPSIVPAGFTLIELLVVMSIIATLAGLAIVGVPAYFRQANKIKCADNLQSIHKHAAHLRVGPQRHAAGGRQRASCSDLGRRRRQELRRQPRSSSAPRRSAIPRPISRQRDAGGHRLHGPRPVDPSLGRNRISSSMAERARRSRSSRNKVPDSERLPTERGRTCRTTARASTSSTSAARRVHRRQPVPRRPARDRARGAREPREAPHPEVRVRRMTTCRPGVPDRHEGGRL